MLNKRRSEFEIISEILSISEGGAKVTEILYRGYMSYTQLRQYLPFLTEREILVEKTSENGNGHSKMFYTTTKGKELLININKTLSYLR